MDRRAFLSRGLGFAAGAAAFALLERPLSEPSLLRDEFGPRPPAYSIVPVIGDGKWIWTKPPDQKGYLEPRQFELKLGIQLQGRGNATEIRATTVAPVELPEQQINDAFLEVDGCVAELRRLAPEAGQLLLVAPGIVRGQVITATVKYKLTLHKEYQGYEKDQFPTTQKFLKDFKRVYMYDSPGIQTRQKEVLQKGDSIYVPEKAKPQRLAADWMQWQGARPNVKYYAQLKPLPPEGSDDPGPGARTKDEKGEWVPAGKLAAEKFVRR